MKKKLSLDEFLLDVKSKTMDDAADMIMSNHSGIRCDNEMSIKLRKQAEEFRQLSKKG